MAKKLAYDRILFAIVLGLTVFGLVMVYSASAARAMEYGTALHPLLIKQLAAAGVGLVCMGIAMHVDYRILARPSVVYGLLGGVLVLLVAVLFSPELNATHRWFFLGPVSIQPAEIAKPALVVFLAYQIARKSDRINEPALLVPSALVTGLLAGLILLQPDLGTAALLTVVALLMLFVAGLSWRYLATAGLMLAPALWLLVVHEPYRLRRMLAFLHPERDPLGSGWQAHQSLIAVGSGGLFGLGLSKSLQKLHYLPHPESDFIFSIVAEELGLVGALALLAAFGVLVWRGLRAGLGAPDCFGRYLGLGLTAVIAIQAFIHMGVAVALLPTKGIPLPFISYGGSSLVVLLTACGVVLSVSQHG